MSNRVICDSGVIPALASYATNMIPTTNTKGLEVLIDTEASLDFRNLTMFGYMINPVTGLPDAIDTGNLGQGLILRRCGFGIAPAGGHYSPGKTRCYVGPNPPGGTTGVHVLYDTTSALNGSLDTGNLLTEDLDSLSAYARASGGTTQIVAYTKTDDNALNLYLATGPAASLIQEMHIGLGASLPNPATGGASTAGVPVPRLTNIQATAAGVGFTVRMVVIGRGRVPGTFAHQIALPPFVSFQLASAGGTARMVVVENT